MVEHLTQLQAGKVYECSDSLGYYGRLKFVGMTSCEQFSTQDSIHLTFEDVDEAYRQVHISLDSLKSLKIQLADQSLWRYWKKGAQHNSLQNKRFISIRQTFRQFLSFS